MTQSRFYLSILAALAVLVGADDSAAQVRPGMGGRMPQQEPSAVFRIYSLAGWAPVELDALNARLTSLPEPYTPIGEDMVMVGAGMHLRFSRMLVGGEGSILFSTDNAEFTDQRRARYSGAYGAVMLGFSVIGTDGLDIYPLIELGMAGVSLEVEERGAPTWDDMLAEPGRSTTLSTGTLFGGAGLGLDYAFRNGILVGLRGMWSYTPDMDEWDADGDDALGGPEVNLRGPSVRLLLGFGGRGRR